MPHLTKEKPIEGGTTEIECRLRGTNGEPINSKAINNITWTLIDENREIVNGNEEICENIDNPVKIILSGDDLPAGKLTLIVNVDYNSTLESGLSLTDSITFYVQDIIEESEYASI